MAIGDIIGAGFQGSSGSAIGSTITVFLGWFLVPLVLFAGMYALWYYMSFNVRVMIYNPTNKQNSLGERDKGKVVRDRDNKRVKGFRLLKNKNDYSGAPIPLRYHIPVKAGFGRVVKEIHFLRDEHGDLQPYLPPNKQHLSERSGMESIDIAWASQEAKATIRALATKKGAWEVLERFAPFIFMAIIVVLLLVLFREMEGVVSGLRAVANQLADVNVGQQVVS